MSVINGVFNPRFMLQIFVNFLETNNTEHLSILDSVWDLGMQYWKTKQNFKLAGSRASRPHGALRHSVTLRT
jgi:hypothetical protein